MQSARWAERCLIGCATALMLVTGFAAQAANPLSFSDAMSYNTGANPRAIAVGDVNRDGILDLITANVDSNNVTVLLGNGDGTFQSMSPYAVGGSPRSVAMGDFNGDTYLDLATANVGTNTVSVLMGNGDGTFQAATSFGGNIARFAIAVVDSDRDGKLDLVTATTGANTVSIFKGNGDGTFQSAVDYSVDVSPQSVATGDFNGDGRPDLAIANYDANNVSILLGTSNGTFQNATPYEAGGKPQAIAIGDFNGDNKLDLAIANDLNPGTVSILLGNGNGTFQTASSYTVGGRPRSVAVGDFNGDGTLDIATANFASDNTSVLVGNSNGTFQTATNYTVRNQPFAVAIGDFNSDALPDLTVGNYLSNSVSVLLNTFVAPVTHFSVSLAAPVIAGTPVNVTVTALTATNATANGYVGTIDFSLLLPDAGLVGLPSSYTFTTGVGSAFDNGVHTFSATFLKAGNQAVTVTDHAALSATGQASFSVTSVPTAPTLVLSPPIPVTAGTPFTIKVTSKDSNDNTVPGHFTFSLGAADASATFAPLVLDFTDAGAATQDVSVTLTVATQTQAITATNTSLAPPRTGTLPVTVAPAAPSTITVVLATNNQSTPVGTAFATPLAALVTDLFGNPTPGIAVTFAISPGIPSGTFGGSRTVTTTTSGIATAPPLTANAAIGGFTVTANLMTNPLATPASFTLTNLPGSLDHFTVSGFPASLIAGTSGTATITAQDAGGNTLTTYAGPVIFASSDPLAVLPTGVPTWTNGVTVVSFTLKTAAPGTATITVKDASPSTHTGSQTHITVNAGSSHAIVADLTTSNQRAQIRTAFAKPVSALITDAFGNPIIGASVSFAAPASGPSGSFGSNAVVTTNGSGVATAPILTANETAGDFIVTASTAGVSVPAQFALSNLPGSTTQLAITLPTSVQAGGSATFIVTAHDPYGNVVTGYTGTVRLVSSDPDASVPTPYTYTPADHGVHAFPVTFTNSGTVTLTVIDVATPTITHSESVVVAGPHLIGVSVGTGIHASAAGPTVGGTAVTIIGSGLSGAAGVTFGGTAATDVVVSGDGTSLTCRTPLNQPASTVDVVVVTPQGTATLPHGYTFVPATVGPSPNGRAGDGNSPSSGGSVQAPTSRKP